MSDVLLALLNSYLKNQVDIDAINDWIARNVWDVPVEERVLIDRVALELAYIDDGYSDEELFRNRIREIIVPIPVP